MAYKPPYVLTRKMNDYVSQILQVIGQLEVVGNLESHTTLRKLNRYNAIK